MKKFLLWITFILLMTACKENPGEPDNTITRDNIINKSIAACKYQFTDSLAKMTDTIYFMITSRQHTDSADYIYFQISKQRKIQQDSARIIITDSTFRIEKMGYPNTDYFGLPEIKYPFRSGEKWRSPTFLVTDSVAGYIRDYKVLTRKYDAYEIIGKKWSPNYEYDHKLYFKPGIGIIETGFNYSNLCPSRRVILRLIEVSYYMPD